MGCTVETARETKVPPSGRLRRPRPVPPLPSLRESDSFAQARRRDDHNELALRNNFDVIRFALAAAVVISHSYSLLGPTAAEREPLFVLTRGQATLGYVAVCGFFVISGYLITMSWERCRSTGDFLRRRARRIYPGFAAASCFGVLVALPLSGRGFPGATDLAYAVYQIVFLEMPLFDSGVFPHNPLPGFLNGSLWTIRHEFWCYIAVAGAGAMGVFRGAGRWLLASALVTSLALLVAVRGFGWDVGWPMSLAGRPLGAWLFALLGSSKAWPGLASAFIAGACYYLVRDRVPLRGVVGAALAIGATAVMAVTALTPPLFAVVLPVAIAFPLFWLAFLPSRFAGFARYGDYSYGVYLYAFPIQQLIACYSPGISVPVMALISLPLSVAAGMASWNLVERWFVRPKANATAAPSQFGTVTTAAVSAPL